MGDRDVVGVRQQAGSAAPAGAAVGVPVRPEGLGELTTDVRIRIAYLSNSGQAVLLVMGHRGGRGLLFKTVPLGGLDLDFCTIPRLRAVR